MMFPIVSVLYLASAASAFLAQLSTTRTERSSSCLLAIPASMPPPMVVFEHSISDAASYTPNSSPTSFQNHARDWLIRQQATLELSDFRLVQPANAAETAAAAPPTKQEIALLREAFAAFYGTTDRDPTKALDLLSQAIEAWQRQPADELAGLYRVRGDCYMALERPNDAIVDYGQAISLLQQPGASEAADPVELPASL
jgi:tetratricopeptide (TPR) repeat protein